MRKESFPYEKFYRKLNSQGLAWDSQITQNLIISFEINEKEQFILKDQSHI